MMDILRQYILSVISAALICGILAGTLKSAAYGKLIRFLCGIFMTATVIAPISRVDLTNLLESYTVLQDDAVQAVSAGENMANTAMADIIKSRYEAYILDKAAQWSADISIDIVIGDGEFPMPEKAVIRGAVSPGIRLKLENLLLSDLGITRENQIWTG